MKTNPAHKEQDYTVHVGRSDPANIQVYVKRVPREEMTRKLAPIIFEIYSNEPASQMHTHSDVKDAG